jgi:mannan endo-1,4-beta-mannosidase
MGVMPFVRGLFRWPSSREAGARAAAPQARVHLPASTGRLLCQSLLSCALLLAPGLSASASADAFVTEQGSQFILAGKPYYVTGVNNHYLAWGSEAEVNRVLDAAVAMGANVVRTILGPVIGAPDGGEPSTIWKFRNDATNSYQLNTHGVYLLYWNPRTKSMGINSGKNGTGKIDYLVAAAAKRHLKLLLVLLDYWPYVGDMQQMDAWYGSTDQAGFFFSDRRTIADYKAWARYLIQHVNPLTGLMYRDDPTIFAWELMNESHARPDLRQSWTETMSRYIKSLDPHHLVSSGGDHITLSELHTPSLDFLVWHGYPKYDGAPPYLFKALIQTNCALAARYHKPVLLEEFGYASNSRDPTQAQAYRMWLKTMAADADCAGWLVWSLVAQQDTGQFPDDTGEWFDIHHDDGATWTVLSHAAHSSRKYANPRG